MKFTLVSRRLLLTGLAVFSSGWIPLPVPTSLIPQHTTLSGKPVTVKASSLQLEWARGRLIARDLNVRLDERELLTTPSAEIHFGLLPFASSFMRPHKLYLKNPILDFDADALAELQPSAKDQSQIDLLDPEMLPELAFEITGGKLHWKLQNGQLLSWQVSRLAGVISPKRSDVQLDGRMLSPIQSNVHAIATAEDFFRAWRFQILGQNRKDSDAWQAQEIPMLRGLEVAPGNYSFKFAAASEPGQDLASTVELNLEDATVTAVDPPIDISNLMLRANGGLREGIQAEFAGTVDKEFQINASAKLQLPRHGIPWLSIRGKTTSVTVDQDRFDWVRSLHPITADILEALEARGGPEAAFAVDWRREKPVSWAVHADTSDMTMRYRGILTDEGDKPSFPYPVHAEKGDFVASDRFLLINTQGRAGIGEVEGEGVVEIYPERTALHLDIHANGVRIDSTVRSAVTGIPALAELWQDLTFPKGGDADIEILIRTEDAELDTGIKIKGQARGAVVRPVELPIQALVEKIDFEWRPGLTTFQGDVFVSQSRLRLQGHVRDVAGSEWPSVQAKLTGRNIEPDWNARRTLVSRLELPKWLALSGPSGSSDLELTYHQPGNTESPQLLLSANGQGADLAWGTQLGPKWLPILKLNRVHTPYFMASALHRHFGVIPYGTMDFGGQEIEFSMLDGSGGPKDGVLLASQRLHTPQPIFAALSNLFKAKEFIGPLTAECWSDLLLEWRGNTANPLYARLNLDPLQIESPNDADPLLLRGELTISNGLIQAPKFRLEQADGHLDLTNIAFHFGPDEQRFKATLNAAYGLYIGPRTYHFLGPQAAAALNQIGLAGELQPRGVKLKYLRKGDGPGVLTVRDGQLELRDIEFRHPVAVTQGRASVDIQQLRWTSDRGVFAQLTIADGSAVVGGLPVQNARANLFLNPEFMQLTDLEAHALGGRVRTTTPVTPNTSFGIRFPGGPEPAEPEPAPEKVEESVPGKLQLGLTKKAPVEAQISFENLDLDRLRDQLGIEPRASGKFSGWAKIKSPTLSPLDFKGRGVIEVSNGRLSEVPVLKQIWGALGIDPPVFRDGVMRFRMDGDSRVRISKLKLDHDLLDIQGKGWVHMDGSLEMKFGLRQVRLLLGIPVTDLPLISHIFDLFTEQDVYGPVDNLHVSTRSMRKILGQDLPRPPFPLWLPDRRQRERGLSPAIPLEPAGADG
jgi:hypothetical protein